MKKLLLIPMLLASAATYMPAAEQSLAGSWTIRISVMGNDAEQSCTFTQKDKELTGTCTGERVDGAVSGAVESNKVKWQLKREGGPTLAFSGTIAADGKITGTVEVSEYSVTGEFTATKVK